MPKKFRDILAEAGRGHWKSSAHYDKSGDGTPNSGVFAGTTAQKVSAANHRRREMSHELADEDAEIRHHQQMKAGMAHFKKHTHRHYFKVPYADREKAKKHGLRWDPQEKHWYRGGAAGGSRDVFKGKSIGPDNSWPHSHTKDV